MCRTRKAPYNFVPPAQFTFFFSYLPLLAFSSDRSYRKCVTPKDRQQINKISDGPSVSCWEGIRTASNNATPLHAIVHRPQLDYYLLRTRMSAYGNFCCFPFSNITDSAVRDWPANRRKMPQLLESVDDFKKVLKFMLSVRLRTLYCRYIL